tara:strand:- start:2370 stop:2555 length:186 start_codon:yes stop_codon:yes gene_type:complete
MAKTNKHIILGLRKKIAAMAEEIMELRTELSKEEEKVFVLERTFAHIFSLLETLQGGGKRA